MEEKELYQYSNLTPEMLIEQILPKVVKNTKFIQNSPTKFVYDSGVFNVIEEPACSLVNMMICKYLESIKIPTTDFEIDDSITSNWDEIGIRLKLTTNGYNKLAKELGIKENKRQI